MEPDEDSNAHWLYHRCVTARVKMETPLNALQLSMKVLHFMNSMDEDDEGVNPDKLFKFLNKKCQAEKKDFSFVLDVGGRAVDLREDGDLSEDALKKVAANNCEGASSIGIGDGACDEGNQGSMAVAVTSNSTALIETSAGIETSSTQQTAPKRQDENVTKYDGVKQYINSDELHCFQLRTRVLGLNMPTFQKLWWHLQAAGWKYLSGKYHIPKGRKNKLSLQYTTEDKAKRIFNHFNLDNCDKSHCDIKESSEEEEGPEIFDGPNELVDYLDEYCMPDYRATTAEIQAQQKEMSAKSKAYKRRCKRLRFELLEVVYLDRLREENQEEEEEEEEEAEKIDVTKEVNVKKEVKGEPSLPSKYGHNHRPCEVCFKGGSPDYPRVACRCCGLVVHTYCYGLLDHDEEESNRRAQGKQRVDEKGLFTCDVCANSLDGGTKKKTWWHAPQSSGWRKHEDPNAKCPLCERKDITGGMVHIVVGEGEGTNGRKKRKRSSRRSEEESSSETWVHLFCLNSLKKTSAGTVRSSESAVNHIHDALKKAANVLIETESMKERIVRCEAWACGTRKGKLLECKGKCGRMFHSLCLQIDCVDAVDWDEKKEHLCLPCRGLISASPDKTIEPTASLAASENEKIDTRISNPSTTASSRQETANNEVDQYFDRKSRKRPMKLEGSRDDVLTIPPQQECAIEVEALHHHSNMDQGFDKFEVQYQQQFGEWSFLLATNQSILLYGIGSKTRVLASFGQHLSTEGDVLSINGFDPSIDLNQFFDCINQLFFGGSGPTQMNAQHPALKNSIPVKDYKGLPRKAASIAKKFASTRTRPLFLLIHNIDGAGLRNRFAQDAIATLTADSKKDGLPLIRIAASVDNVNASLIWSPQVEHKFDWAWKKVDTYRPYFEEVKHLPQAEASKKVTKNTGKRKHGAGAEALKVLEYLAPRIKEVLQLLATLQVGNTHHPIPYTMLRQECTKKMLTGSDANLRSFLKELSDHNMVVSEKGDDGIEHLFVPSTIPMHEILSSKPY